MVKTLYKLFILLGFVIVAQTAPAPAQDKKDSKATEREKPAPVKKTEDANEVSTVISTPDKNAFYDDKGQFSFEVKNGTNNLQVGKVSYQVFTETGQKLNSDSIKVKIGKKSSETYNFQIPESKPGFYKVSFMVNVTDYDDTSRRVFGIRPDEIKSPYHKPADFESFWQTAKSDLAKVAPNFKTTPRPDLDSKKRKVYAIEMQSLDNMTIRGWMTIPKTNNTHRKFSVWLGLPGYQVDLKPILSEDEDLAIITLNIRGQGNSRDRISTPKSDYIFYHIEDKNRYVMRGAIMDCVRCIDYIFSRPELKHDNVFVTGGSMGGFLSMATASLDSRVTICSAQNPIFGDVRNLVGEVEWPMSDIQQYVATRPGLTMDRVLNNLDYFDIKNFSTNITCPVLMGIGLLDPLAPPNNEYAAFNNLPNKKRILVFKDLGHEVNQVFATLEARWMMDTFALF